MDLGPAASGQRRRWAELPDSLRAAIGDWLGAPVVRAISQESGFSPGVAARLVTADGQRVFVKAVAAQPNPDSPAIHRLEARIVAALPPAAPVPRLLWQHDEGGDGWVVLLFEDIEGHAPRLPWVDDELERVLRAMERLSEALTPAPAALADIGRLEDWYVLRQPWWSLLRDRPPVGLDDWSRQQSARLATLAAAAAAAGAGTTLLHLDLRADNLLLTSEQVLFVDWPHARLGAPWVDLVFLAPSVAMQGGPSPATLVERYPPARAADPAALTVVVAAMAGFFTYQALQPAPPGLPTLRPFQAAQGVVARHWLAERLNLAIETAVDQNDYDDHSGRA